MNNNSVVDIYLLFSNLYHGTIEQHSSSCYSGCDV